MCLQLQLVGTKRYSGWKVGQVGAGVGVAAGMQHLAYHNSLSVSLGPC